MISWVQCSTDDLNCVIEVLAGTFDGENVVAYITDADNNLESYDDKMLTIATENGLQKDITSGELGNMDFVILPNETEKALVWYEDGNIGYISTLTREAEKLFNVDEIGNSEHIVGNDFKFVGNRIVFSNNYFGGDSGIYSIDYENGTYGLYGMQMSEPVYATVYKDSVPVSDTLCYSIESYVYAMHNSADETLNELLVALMKYGNAAYEYAN